MVGSGILYSTRRTAAAAGSLGRPLELAESPRQEYPPRLEQLTHSLIELMNGAGICERIAVDVDPEWNFGPFYH